MMHPVHVRCDDDQAQEAIERKRHPDIAVVEHRGGVQHDLEDHHRDRGRAKQEDDGGLDQHRQDDLGRVKPQTGRHVELQVGVVHPMQPP